MTRTLLVVIVALFVGLGIFYNVTTPIFETPDEVWHFAYTRQLALNHALPVVDAEGKEPYRHEGLQPPLYYAIGSLFISWMSEQDLQMPTPNPFARIGEPRAQSNDNRNAFLHSGNEQFPFHGTALAVHLIRFYSLLLSIGTILLTYALAREIFPEQPLFGLCAAAYVAFLPQFIFISSAISNDNLATLLTVATLWQLARVMRTGLENKHIIILGIFVGAGLLTKLTTIALTPFVIITLLYAGYRHGKWQQIIANGILFGLVVTVLAGWWYFRNLTLYGDFTTFGRLAILVGERARPLNFWRWVSAEGEGLRLSLWGVFGWFNILASPPFYFFFDALAVLGLAGIIVALVQHRHLSIRLAILPLWCVMIFVAFWGYASIIVTAQGRLLFPALPAWAILWSWGVFTLFARWQSKIIPIFIAAQCVIAAFVPIWFISPAYTPSIINAIPDHVTEQLNWQFDNGVEIIATSLDKASIRPGETLNVTIYQRVPTGKIEHSAMFIHIVNSAGVIVAQRDSLIGCGNLRLQVTPVIIADAYSIPIPLTVPVQGDWYVVAGMYDPVTEQRAQATSTNGQPLGDELTIDTIHTKPTLANSWNYDFDGRTMLTHAELTQDIVKPGATLPITLHWRNDAPGYNVFIHALGANERAWASLDTPIDATRPMQINLPFAPDTPPGIYPIELGIYPPPYGDRVGVFDRNGQASGDRIFLGPVRVATP